MGRWITLGEAARDLTRVEVGLPAARHMLAWVRHQTGQVLASIVLANGVEPTQGDAGSLLAAAAATCNGIEELLDEVAKEARVVREFFDRHPELHAHRPPHEIWTSWGRFNVSYMRATIELERLRAAITS